MSSLPVRLARSPAGSLCPAAALWLGLFASDPAGALAQTGVNLRAAAVSAPAAADRGATISVSLGLEALGGAGRASYAVLLAVGEIRTGAQELGRFGPVDLPAGTLVRRTVDVTLPAGLTGVRRILVEVDPADGVAETNENDNLAFAAADTLVLAPRAEVGVRDVTVSATRVEPGDPLEVSFVVDNQGRVPATVPAAVVIGRDVVATPSDRELARVSPTIAPGSQQTPRVTLTVPADLAAGSWRVGVVLDPDVTLDATDLSRRAAVAASPVVVVQTDLVLLTRSLPDGVLSRPYATRLEARGGDGTFGFTVTGSLPDGLAFDPITRLVTGTPARAGAFPIALEVSSAGLTDAADVELRVQPTGLALQVVTTTVAPGFVDRPYLQLLIAGGGEPPYRWAVASGDLPEGLALDPVSGRIEGTPLALGTSELILTVEDDLGASRSAPVVLTIGIAPEILIQTARVEARVGEPLDVPLEAVGGVRPLRWAAVTPPPPGLEVSESGRMVGTPTEVGRFPLQVSATDATRPGVRDLAFVEVDVSDTGILRITSGPLPEIVRFAFFEHELTAEGGTPPYFWSLVPGDFLPEGFALVPGPERDRPLNTGVVYGRAFDAALSGFTVRVEDAYGRIDEQALVFFVDETGSPPASGGGGCRAGARAPYQGGGWHLGLFGLLLLARRVVSTRLRTGCDVSAGRRARRRREVDEG